MGKQSRFKEEAAWHILWRCYYLFLIFCPLVMLLLANKDFFRYRYKIDTEKKITAKAWQPTIVDYKEERWMKTVLDFEYEGDSHYQMFWRKIGESEKRSTCVYPVEAEGNPEKVIFMRGFIFPYILVVYAQMAFTWGVILNYFYKRTKFQAGSGKSADLFGKIPPAVCGQDFHEQLP